MVYQLLVVFGSKKNWTLSDQNKTLGFRRVYVN